MTEGGDYFDENCKVLDMDVHNYPNAAEREMSCILKIPVNVVVGRDIGEFLAQCSNIGGDLVNINPQNNDALRAWDRDRGTKDAFEVLLALRQ